ncbi:MAG: coproporphyrinogen III oxidase [Ignavibacteria bacterium RIFOXYB2_FULL_35_12]|nr:MAG: coproporphyrinogen III oxidase [Ignavibacteria bacterium GWC2_35_8]OGU57407.1 MAG: coproporphyrinogen III oxidase [Ignavibacteria bacterium GWF2_35_20]OGU79011.1 MAG: coproporphyrinogen III oxidase [Ignavibacteria bacterium RIFOXYA2_FULL_35_9]OGU88344.1 MAG: coproporphyrinogen III oxidase [Ignavibacteria bacterium RIFOXYC12_FULL_35_11]OGU91585.1 MAG: coproporphyrinogen III oxidase [Ignavibacteria bacterium RIFOXYA12_FULL_35_25]OGU97871.1 MAG: coproporphyrinogen III oxidase [Ignavibacte
MNQLNKTNVKETAIYIHIPFCEHKCIYCDFYSIITKDNITSFLQALKKEISYYADLHSLDRIVTSIFFGGGTPSLMSPAYINEIIELVKKRFTIANDVEVTLETNPGTVEQIKLKEFKEIGINRLSVGIQSFDENELKFLTRIHNKQTAINTVLKAKGSGFKNISIDLIFNLPAQTKKIWMDNLITALSLPINHISTYSLILERGTILNKMVLDGKVKIQSDDYDADLYETTVDFLTQNGFYQYEVSNFAKAGFECRHNNSYWHYKDYFGFGTSAHSFINGRRYWNFSSLKKYIAEIEKNNFAVAGSESPSDEQRINEFVMLALRSSGISIERTNLLFGTRWLLENNNYLLKLESENYLSKQNGVIKLTKRGYTVCDEIIKNLT